MRPGGRALSPASLLWALSPLLRRLRPHGESVEGRDVVEADALWKELHRLAYRQRCVMVLRYYEDLSEHQTAEVLNCSVGAVEALTKERWNNFGRTSEARRG